MSDRARDSEDRAIPDVTHLTSKLNRDDLDRTDAPESSESPTIPPPQGEAPSPGEAPTIPPKVGVESEGETLAPSAPAAVSATMAEVRIPGYEIIRELGRGGMGVVYQARQTRVDRVVALKMILSGAHAGPDDLARFRTEAEAVARLQHPGIVQIFEVGEHNGLPFFSLEFCPGGALDGKLSGTPMQPNDAAALVQKLAEAMSAAHEQSVIHRDLKPANVLLDANANPKITDFGLAKKLDEASQTQSGSVMGTPSYMAPEQARAKTDQGGPGADVYALGAILYDCMTGRPPFRAATAMDTVLQVLSKEPVPPRELQPDVPKDLETICLKCLQKDPGKRYGSADELSEDLRRFRAHEPIRARPVGRAERAWRWCRRNPAVASLLTLVMVVLLSGVVISSYFAIQSQRNADQAQRNADRAEQRAQQLAEQKKTTERALARAHFINYAYKIDAARRTAHQGDFLKAREILRTTEPGLRGWEHDFVYRLTQPEALMKGHTSYVKSVAFSSDGKRIVSGSSDKTVIVWDAITGKPIRTIEHGSRVSSVSFSPDGKWIVSGGGEHARQGVAENFGIVKVWDAQTGETSLTLKGHTAYVRSVAFSPDGKLIASGSYDKTVRVWDMPSGVEVLTLSEHTREITHVAFSPDGKHIASGSYDLTVRVWDAATGKEAGKLRAHPGWVSGVDFSPDGKRIVSGGGTPRKPGEVKVWDRATGKEILQLRGHSYQVTSVAYSLDGKRIVSASADGAIKVWDAVTGVQIRTFKVRTNEVTSVAFSPDGTRIVGGGHGPKVEVWEVDRGSGARALLEHRGIRNFTFSPDGKRILAWTHNRPVKIWDAVTGVEALTLRGHTWPVISLAFSPDGKRIVTGGGGYDRARKESFAEVKVWDAKTGTEVLTIKGHTNYVRIVAFSPDGKRIASGSGKEVKVWDAVTGEEAFTLKGHASEVLALALSPDGKRIATGGYDKTIKLWDSVTGAEVLTVKGHRSPISTINFTPDGKHIASGDGNSDQTKTIKLWNVVNGIEVFTLKGHTASVRSLAFSPDGKRIVSSSTGDVIPGEVKVWDAATGEEALELKVAVSSVSLSPDGKRLVGAGADGSVKIWDASSRE